MSESEVRGDNVIGNFTTKFDCNHKSMLHFRWNYIGKIQYVMAQIQKPLLHFMPFIKIECLTCDDVIYNFTNIFDYWFRNQVFVFQCISQSDNFIYIQIHKRILHFTPCLLGEWI